jgi:uncharacterized protein (TIGR00251 family)
VNELPLRFLRDGVALDLYVQPRAGKNEIVGLQGSELKIRLTSPPVEGAANKLCCEFFADLLGIAKSHVSIISGDKSRHKKLFIRGVTVDEVRCVLTEKIPPP